ncbi:MAG TPA: cupin domain-containing protein [Myxococcaceae bacterium]
MNDRAQELIRLLALRPHPEGGHYCEDFRSLNRVSSRGRDRAALTSIYFLLVRGERSRWHRVAGADELWTYLEGDPIELWELDPAGAFQRHTLGPVAPDRQPQHVIRAGHWQGARPLGEYALVTCAVGPGFEFDDFALLASDPKAAEALLGGRPELAELL